MQTLAQYIMVISLNQKSWLQHWVLCSWPYQMKIYSGFIFFSVAAS